jgi:hypothetical protein
MAKAFFDAIVRLHGFLSSIVSDRDLVFRGHVWCDIFKLAGIRLWMSTVFHRQTDGQSELVNKTIVMYLRSIIGDRLLAGKRLLAEYRFNTSYHSVLLTTPFEVVYGRPPLALLPYTAGAAHTDTVDALLKDCDTFLTVQDHLLQALAYAKKHSIGFGSGFLTSRLSLWCLGHATILTHGSPGHSR